MAFIAFDDDVSDDGVATWSSAGVLFTSVEILSMGVIPRPVDNSDHVLRAGWFSLGNSLDFGAGGVDYWRSPIYVDFEHFIWTPEPTGDGGGNSYVQLADRVRWHFSAGVSAHVRVFCF